MAKTATIARRIAFFEEDISFQPKNKKGLRHWIIEIVQQKGWDILDLNYIFVSDAYLLKQNQEKLQHDYYTDIITLYYQEKNETHIHSDIFISIERVRENAQELGVSFEEELRRVMIHGVLHQIGYDDSDSQKKAEMRQAENEALALWKNFEK